MKITFQDKINKFRADLTDHLISSPDIPGKAGDEITITVRSKLDEDGVWQEYQTPAEKEFADWQDTTGLTD